MPIASKLPPTVEPYFCRLIVPTLCVGTQPLTLRVTVDAERPDRHYHAERGND